MSWCVSPWIYSTWDSLWLLNLIDYFLSMLGKFSTIISSKTFSYPFFFSSVSGIPYNSNVGAFDIVRAFDIVPEVSETILSSFHSFYFILLFRIYFHHFNLPAHWFVLLLQIFCYWFLLEYFSEKAVAPHSSTLAWKIPWMEEPGGLQSMGSLRVRHSLATSLWLFTLTHWKRKWQPIPVFLPGESQGQGSLVATIYGVAQSRKLLKQLSSSMYP